MNFIYKVSHSVLRGLFTAGFRWKVTGSSNIPDKGPLIVAANHMSNFDPPILGAALTRKIHYMAKKDLFNNPFLGKILETYDAFPVKRGTADMGALKTALRLLKQEKVLGVFPEGTRNAGRELKAAKPGIIMLATKSEAPILPVGLSGTPHPIKEELKVNIGVPFTLDDYYSRKLDKTEIKEAGKEIMTRIDKLLPER
jgi:1-acyl-sn-glycerol-3-phosphate acyltransferase